MLKKQQSEPRLSNKWKMQFPTAQHEYSVDGGLSPGYAFMASKHIKSTSLLHSASSILTELPLACQDYEKRGSKTTQHLVRTSFSVSTGMTSSHNLEYRSTRLLMYITARLFGFTLVTATGLQLAL